jgi:signal transduction histidine kinase
MSSNETKIKRNSLSRRLTLRFVVTLIFSNICMIIAIFFLLRDELAQKDKTIAAVRYHEVNEVIENHGVEHLTSAKEDFEFNHFEDMLIRIVDLKGVTVFEKLPNRMSNFNKEDLERTLTDAISSSGFHTVPPKMFLEETIELYSGVIPGYKMVVGINTDASEDFMNLYLRWALILTLCSCFFSVSVGYYFSHKALSPIRNLIDAVKKIREGDLRTVLPYKNSEDELSELTQLFNEMIAQIGKLIETLQISLDSIAHDIRTPLTHIANKLESKIRESDSITTKEQLGDLLEETYSISSLINSLLELSEAQSQTLILRKENFNLREAIDECIEIYEYIIEEKKAHIQIICEDTIFINADRNKFKRILANLIDNSLNYSSENPQIIISCRVVDGQTVLNVIDNGKGISKNDSAHIWDRLFRGDASRNTSGSGLGLSFVKSLVDSHGWTITLIDKAPPSSGTHFKIKMN